MIPDWIVVSWVRVCSERAHKSMRSITVFCSTTLGGGPVKEDLSHKFSSHIYCGNCYAHKGSQKGEEVLDVTHQKQVLSEEESFPVKVSSLVEDWQGEAHRNGPLMLGVCLWVPRMQRSILAVESSWSAFIVSTSVCSLGVFVLWHNGLVTSLVVCGCSQFGWVCPQALAFCVACHDVTMSWHEWIHIVHVHINILVQSMIQGAGQAVISSCHRPRV
jgi:hypothetical protein